MAEPFEHPFAMAIQDPEGLGALPQQQPMMSQPPMSMASAIGDPQMVAQPMPAQAPVMVPEQDQISQMMGGITSPLTPEDIAAQRQQFAEQVVNQGFTAADDDGGDTVGFEPAGGSPLAQVQSQQPQSVEPERTEGQKRAMQMAELALQARGTRGDGGRRTKALLAGRTDQAVESLQQAAAPIDELETQAGIDQELVGDAEVQRLETESAQLGAIAREKANQVESLGILRQEHAKESAREQQAQAQMAEQIAADTEALSQEQVRDRRTPGQKTLATIAVALGGIGAAIQNSFGGMNGAAQNDALGVINAQIERDIDNQVRALSRRQTALAARGRQYDRLGSIYSNNDARREAARSMQATEYQTILEATAAKHAGTNKGEAAGQLALAIQADRSGRAFEAAKAEAAAAAANVSQSAQAQFDDELTRAKRGERGGRNKLAEKAREKLVLGGIDLELEGRGKGDSPEAQRLETDRALPGGLIPTKNPQGGMGPANKKQADAAFDIQKKFSNYRVLINELKTLAKDGTTLGPTARVKAQAVIQGITAAESVMFDQGAMTDDEYERKVDLAMVNPTEATIADALEAVTHREQVAGRLLNGQLEGTNTRIPGVSTGGTEDATADELEATLQ